MDNGCNTWIQYAEMMGTILLLQLGIIRIFKSVEYEIATSDAVCLCSRE